MDWKAEDFARRHGLSQEARRELQRLLKEPDLPGATIDTGATISPPSDDVPPTTPTGGARYTRQVLLGRGGMGEVYRVHDAMLHRHVAMKLLRAEYANNMLMRQRFTREARMIGLLQHPGIVPLYDQGTLEDGAPYYTMQEVGQTTLGDLIQQVYQQRGTTAWSRRRLLSAFVSICETMAYVHKQGIIHRDLKPANIMVGQFGQVVILDWGLARDLTESSEHTTNDPTPRVQNTALTRAGVASGTLGFMPPEQARGELDRLDKHSDIYALGGILYMILHGHAPYAGMDATALLVLLTQDPDPPAGSVSEEMEPLLALCQHTMHPDPHQRPDDAQVLAQQVRDWLDGARKRSIARQIVADTASLLPEIQVLQDEAMQKRRRARERLKTVQPWSPEQEKAPIWALEDEAGHDLRTALMLKTRYEQALQGALTHCADLDEAHVALAEHYQALHRELEQDQHMDKAKAVALRISRHVAQLPPHSPERQTLEAYLSGEGALTLHTNPPGATVWIAKEEEVNRRLQPGTPRLLGKTPLDRVPIQMGSYRLRLEAPGHAPTTYPITISRQHHWSGTPPDQTTPHPVSLPLIDELGVGECYVPAGWCTIGGDPDNGDAPPRRRVWVDGFIIQRDPVSIGDYLQFLDALKMRGDDVRAHIPTLPGTTSTGNRHLFSAGPDGRFRCLPNLQEELQPEYPVCYIDWYSATAYTRWHAQQTGQPWQLPSELWWEKAARGTDARLFPWGNHYDMSWRHCRLSQPEPHPIRLTPGKFQTDTSPYGVRGLAGGVRDWMRDVFDPQKSETEHRFRSVRGGAYDRIAKMSNNTFLNGSLATARDSIGFRMARPFGHTSKTPLGKTPTPDRS